MARALWLLVLAAALPAPAQRVVAHFDGSPTELLTIEGRHAFVHDEKQVAEGRGALLLRPSEADPYYGVTARFLRAHQPRTLRLHILQLGDKPFTYLMKIEDEGSPREKEDAGYLEKECAPGQWTDIEIDLSRVPNRSGSRMLDFTTGVRSFRFSRKKASLEEPGFIIDSLRFHGEPDDPELLRSVRAALTPGRPEDGDARARVLREGLPILVEIDRLRAAVQGLEKEPNERARRACREALTTLGHEESAFGLVAALAKTKGEARLEMLWALATMSSRSARTEALRLAADPKTPWPERTALLGALGLEGATDLGSAAAACLPTGPWPERAALVKALLECSSPAAVDLLIKILEKPGHPRVESDAADALARLSGKDLGANAKAWAEWWKANRATAPLVPRERPKGEGYGTFFGVPVGPGRLAFVLDASGSMRDPAKGGRARQHVAQSKHLQDVKIESRLDLATAEMAHALRSLPANASAGVLFFNDEIQWLTKGFEKAEPGMKERTLQRLEGLSAGQKTNIHDALLAAFRPGKKPGPKEYEDGADTIYLLTDGEPSAGPIREWQELRDAVLRWNLGRAIRIHVITLGDQGDPSTTGFSAWCKATGGVFQDLSSERKKDDQGGKDP